MTTDAPFLHAQIEHHPGLLDSEFDRDLDDLAREFEEIRTLLDAW